MMRHVPLARTSPLKRTKPIPRVSKRRRREGALYQTARLTFLAFHPSCERCGAPATDVHHRRGRVGADYLEPTVWLATCRVCHEWIHAHPAEAYERGWSDRRIRRSG